MTRDWSSARSYGRKLQSIHLLERLSKASGDDVLSILDVNTPQTDAQPKKITISGLGASVAPYVALSSGSAVGPNSSIQYNDNGTLNGTENVLFNGSGLYASGVTSPSYTTNLANINNITATGYLVTNADNGRTLVFSSSSPIAVQVPAGLSPGFNCTFIQSTVSGQVTLTSGTSVSMNSAYNAFKTTTRYSVAGLIGVASNSYIVTGDITI